MTYESRHSSPVSDDLVAAAREWVADDPDEQTRAELGTVITAAEGVTPQPSPTSPTASPGCCSSGPPACAAPSGLVPTG